MGYRTYHTLTITENKSNLSDEAIIDDLRSSCEEAEYAFNDEGCPEDDCKWYDMEDDMRNFSKKYPDVVLCIHGEGEESGDLWDFYFKGGKAQGCSVIIEYPKFNETELK